MRKMINEYRILFGNSEGRRLIGRPGNRWVDNIKTDLKGIGIVGVDWINLGRDGDRWQDTVNIVLSYCAASQLLNTTSDENKEKYPLA
jgi:hypothetical protein